MIDSAVAIFQTNDNMPKQRDSKARSQLDKTSFLYFSIVKPFTFSQFYSLSKLRLSLHSYCVEDSWELLGAARTQPSTLEGCLKTIEYN